MENESRTELVITSKVLSPKEIGSLVGMQCDGEWKIGDKRGITIIIEIENGCFFKSRLPKSEPLEKHVRNLLEYINPVEENIRSLPETCEIDFNCVIYHYQEGTPELNFERKIIKKISNLRAALDIDLYMLWQEE